jgi:hypothetical protein
MEQQLADAVEAGTMTAEEADEWLWLNEPLKFTRTARGLIAVEGLIAKRYPPAYTPREWRRIADRMVDILTGLEQFEGNKVAA